MDIDSLETKYCKVFLKDNIKRLFFVKSSNTNNLIEFKLEKDLDLNYHIKLIDYSDFQRSYPLLHMNKDKFIHFIIESMETSEFEIIENKDELKNLEIIYWIDVGKGKYLERFKFFVILEKEIKPIRDNLGDISEYVKKMYRKFDAFKNSIEIKFVDMDERLSKRIKSLIDNLFEENKNILSDLEKDLIKYNLNERRELEYEKLDLYKDIYYIDSIRNQKKNKELNFIEGIELYPNLSDSVDSTNIKNISNKNFIKLTNGWRGIKGNSISSALGIFKFSIQINACTKDCNIMIGYCLNSQNGINGFYNNNCIVMLNLSNGNIYCPSNGNVNLSFRANEGMIITALIDTEMKYVVFFMNGYQLLQPRSFKLTNNNDINQICPCVDLFDSNDSISIVKY